MRTEKEHGCRSRPRATPFCAPSRNSAAHGEALRGRALHLSVRPAPSTRRPGRRGACRGAPGRPRVGRRGPGRVRWRRRRRRRRAPRRPPTTRRRPSTPTPPSRPSSSPRPSASFSARTCTHLHRVPDRPRSRLEHLEAARTDVARATADVEARLEQVREVRATSPAPRRSPRRSSASARGRRPSWRRGSAIRARPRRRCAPRRRWRRPRSSRRPSRARTAASPRGAWWSSRRTPRPRWRVRSTRSAAGSPIGVGARR